MPCFNPKVCYNSKLHIMEDEYGYEVGIIMDVTKPTTSYKSLTNFDEESDAKEFVKQYNKIANTPVAKLYIENYKRLGAKMVEYIKEYKMTDYVSNDGDTESVCENDLHRIKKQTTFIMARQEEAHHTFNDFVIDTILLSYIDSGEEDEAYLKNFQYYTTFDNFLCLVLIHFPEWIYCLRCDHDLEGDENCDATDDEENNSSQSSLSTKRLEF